jgi:hypothetical protein
LHSAVSMWHVLTLTFVQSQKLLTAFDIVKELSIRNETVPDGRSQLA